MRDVEPVSQTPESIRFYRPELDGLRFFAFFAVYLNHTLLFGVGEHAHGVRGALETILGTIGVAGAFGVDLFFALSAYLITELLLREHTVRGTLDVRAFYTRRILRIWPLYFSFLLFARLLSMTVPGEAFSWAHFGAFALFSGNWMYMVHPVATVAAPLWSVAVEEQFYIFWPLAVRRARIGQMAAIAVGIVALGAAIRLGIALAGHNDPWIARNSLTRADAIAAGILVALVLRGRLPRISAGARALLLAGALGTLLVVARTCSLFAASGPAAAIVLGWSAVALACTGILVAVLGVEGLAGAFLRAPLLVFHQVGLLIAARLFPGHLHHAADFVGHFVVGLVLTVAFAAASYRWLETPFLRLKAQRYSIVPSRPDDEPASGRSTEGAAGLVRDA